MTRGFAALSAVAAMLLVACLAAFDEGPEESGGATVREGLMFPDLAGRTDEVVAIDVQRASGAFTLARGSAGWSNQEIDGYPARVTRIAALLAALETVEYVAPRTARERRYPKLGVEDVSASSSSTRVTLRAVGGGVLADLIVGHRQRNALRRGNRGTYVRRPGDARAWLASGALDVHHDAVDWSERDLARIDAERVAALELLHPDGERIDVMRDPTAGGRLALSGLEPGVAVRRGAQLEYLVRMFETLAFLDVRRRSASMTSSDGPRVVVRSRDGLVLMLQQVAAAERDRTWAVLEARADPDAAGDVVERAELLGRTFEGWVYLLPQAVTERLRIRLENITGTAGS